MEVTPEASTAMGMAFTSWGMPMGKVYELHLRLHDQHQQVLEDTSNKVSSAGVNKSEKKRIRQGRGRGRGRRKELVPRLVSGRGTALGS